MKAPEQMKVKATHLLYSGMGGLGTYFMNFVESDQEGKFGHSAIFGGIEPLYPEYGDFCEENDIRYQVIKKTQGVDLRYYKETYRGLCQFSPDVLIVHSLSVVLPAIVYARRHGAKLVVVDHTNKDAKTRLEWYYLLFAQRWADEVVYFFPGQFEALKLRFPSIKGKKNHCIIPKTANTDFFTPSKGKTGTGLAIGMAARMVEGKDFNFLIENLRQLREKCPVDISLHLAGDGPIKEGLETLAKEGGLTLSEDVVFRGMLSREELLGFYQGLDIYVHATQGETICYSIMEAQACGLPIVASDVEGVNNTLKDGENALLFKRDDSRHFVEQLLRLIEEEGLRKNMAGLSRHIAEESNLKNNMASRFHTLYTDII